MKTFNETVTDYKALSRDASTENETLGKSLVNTFLKKILVARDWVFNRSSFTDKSVAAQQNYPLPYNCWRVRSVKVTVGTLNYFPTEVTSREVWTKLNRTVVSSDVAQKFFVEKDHIEIYPVPATNDNDITIYFQKLILALGVADYGSGLEVTVVAQSLDVSGATGSPTAFTAAMVGRSIKFDDDGYWYEIATVGSPTALTLKREARLSITEGTFTISELIPLPFGHEDIPLWWALSLFFQAEEQPMQAREYERMWKEGLTELLRRDAKTTGQVLEKSDIEALIGLLDINDYPLDIS